MLVYLYDNSVLRWKCEVRTTLNMRNVSSILNHLSFINPASVFLLIQGRFKLFLKDFIHIIFAFTVCRMEHWNIVYIWLTDNNIMTLAPDLTHLKCWVPCYIFLLIFLLCISFVSCVLDFPFLRRLLILTVSPISVGRQGVYFVLASVFTLSFYY